MVWSRGEYTISDEHEHLDMDRVEAMLHASFWAATRPREVIEKSVRNSFVMGVYHEGLQVGFARVVTDYATFAWLCDVFVDESHRGRGLSKWLMEVLMVHEDLQGFRRWILATRDAQELYGRYGFTDMYEATHWMEKRGDDYSA